MVSIQEDSAFNMSCHDLLNSPWKIDREYDQGFRLQGEIDIILCPKFMDDRTSGTIQTVMFAHHKTYPIIVRRFMISHKHTPLHY